jgi:hypothetical protein
MMTHPFHEPYRATTYRVFVPRAEPIDLRIDEPSAALDVLLDGENVRTWAFITAWNPGSRQLPREENDKRQAALASSIERHSWRFLNGVGIPARQDWQAEESFLVLGISSEAALALAKRFGQNAIVAGERGGAALLLYVTS